MGIRCECADSHQNLLRCHPSGERIHANTLSSEKALLSAVKACTTSRDLKRGRAIHAEATRYGPSSYISTSLIKMYSNCGTMSEAQAVFNQMIEHDVASWTALILGYVDNGESKRALGLVDAMQAQGCELDSRVFVAAIKACTNLSEVEKMDLKVTGMAIHSHALETLGTLNRYLVSSLIVFYAKCCMMLEARRLFESLSVPDVVAWNALILGYVDNGETETALSMFQAMSCSPDSGTFVAVLKACTGLAGKEPSTTLDGKLVKVLSLEKGMAVHALASRKTDILVGNGLIDFYAKSGSLEDAQRVFEELRPRCDTVSWTCLMLGYAESGESNVSLELFERMQQEGCVADHRAFVAVTKACGRAASKAPVDEELLVKVTCLEKGMAIHSQASKFESNVFLACSLVEMYSNCGSMPDACRAFGKVRCPSNTLWNTLMAGYVDNGHGELALGCFMEMEALADERTFVLALKACSILASKESGILLDGRLVKLASLERGVAIHARAALQRYEENIFVANSLISLFAACGCPSLSLEVFRRIQTPDVVSWNALLLGYAENGDGEGALELFAAMQSESCRMDSRTFVYALKACLNLARREKQTPLDGKPLKVKALELSFALHALSANTGFNRDSFVGNTLCELYGECGSMVDACMALKRIPHWCVVSWTTLMKGYVVNGEAERALTLFTEMQCVPDSRTYVTALQACSHLAGKETGLREKVKTLEKGFAIHSEVEKLRYGKDVYVAASLVDMYAKCGSVTDARTVFDNMEKQDEVALTSLILAYAESEQGEMALKTFIEFKSRYHGISSWTLAALIKACAGVGALSLGKDMHAELCKLGLECERISSNSLLEFYGKAGALRDAQLVFDTSLRTYDDVMSWSLLIEAYSRQGDTELVFELFREMVEREMKPESVTVLSVLAACNHAGLIGRGKELVARMEEAYGARPRLEHYHCLIDMFGRANEAEDGHAVLETMPFEASVVSWTSLLQKT